jgi:hypothetical protein
MSVQCSHVFMSIIYHPCGISRWHNSHSGWSNHVSFRILVFGYHKIRLSLKKKIGQLVTRRLAISKLTLVHHAKHSVSIGIFRATANHKDEHPQNWDSREHGRIHTPETSEQRFPYSSTIKDEIWESNWIAKRIQIYGLLSSICR